ITGVSTGSVVTFSFTTAAGNIATHVSIAGQGATGNPTPPDFDVPAISTYTVTPADASDGQSDFQVQVTTSPSQGQKAAANYTVACIPSPAHPSWKLVKAASPLTFTAAGQVINYSYTLTNTGNVTINTIAVSDNKVATVSCPVSSLAAGASTTCSGAYTTTAADVTAGSVTNTATAHGTPTSGTLADASAQATKSCMAPRSGKVVKSASPVAFTAAGERRTINDRRSTTRNM